MVTTIIIVVVVVVVVVVILSSCWCVEKKWLKELSFLNSHN